MSLWKLVFLLCTDWVVFVVFTLHAFFVTACAYVMQQFERHPKWDLHRISVNGFQLYIGFGCPYEPKNSSHRFGAVFVFLGAFLINIILCTKILTIFTSPMQETQVKSIEDIVNGEFQLVGDRFAYHTISQQNQVV